MPHQQEYTTRPLQPHERHFAEVMAEHYRQRVKSLPHATILWQSLHCYEQRLKSDSIVTLDLN